MPRIKKKKKTATILLAVVIAMSGAGLAFAYWTSGGSGSGTGATGTSQSVVIVQTTELNAMGPGVAAQSLSGTFNNPGPSAATISTVTATVGSVTGPNVGAGGCEADDYVIAGTIAVTGSPVAMGDGVGSWTGATIAFKNEAAENQDGCQGATVHLAYSSS